ncbi:MAG: glycosidase [Catenulispora sp.]|nr:glycosidase [Catenulispora sp.]
MAPPNADDATFRDLFRRDPANPILTPDDWPYRVNTVFNPGATIHDGETVLLCRIEDRRGMSHLTVARSPDGVHGWRVDSKPLLSEDPGDATSMWGVEDGRITYVPELETYAIAYTAYGPSGPCVALALTEDFLSVEKLGPVMPPEDKDAALLPRRVNDEFVLYHRPVATRGTARPSVWLSRSRDLRHWTAPEPVLAGRQGPWWDAVRVGIGPAPLETEHGWLGIYHGVKQMPAGPIYRVGLVMFDLDEPARVIRRTPGWIMGPETDYEKCGDVPNVVFPTGLLHDAETGALRLYYGAGDSVVAMATGVLDEVVDYLMQYG